MQLFAIEHYSIIVSRCTIEDGTMGMNVGKYWKFLVMFSIILPVMFIFAVKFPDLTGDPTLVAATSTSQQVQWEFERPSFSPDRALWLVSPHEVLERNSYENDKVNVTFIVSPLGFILTDPVYDGSSDVALNANLTASVSGGYLEYVRLTFNESYVSSQVRLLGLLYSMQAPEHATLSNLTVTDAACLGFRETLLKGDVKAYINAVGANSSREVMIDTGPTAWILKAPANVSQQLEVSAEVTYFNGTNHISVVLPTVLRMIPDAGNTFEDARTITAGSYSGTVSNNWDPVDCYKIWLNKGQKVTISTTVSRLGANVSLYDPLGRLMGSVQSTWGLEPKVSNRIECTVQSDGYWYVQVSATDDQGLYRLNVGLT